MAAGTIAGGVFLATLGGAWLGMMLGRILPVEHLSQESKDVISLGSGFVATMAALVIGLMVSSAKDAYDLRRDDIDEASIAVIQMDRLLAQYGAEAGVARHELEKMTRSWIHHFWRKSGQVAPDFDPFAGGPPLSELVEKEIRALAPASDAQKHIQDEALDLMTDITKMRWTLFEEFGRSTVPLPFLVVLGLWLSLIFASFGLFAPRNATVASVFVICSLSAACSILLIVDLEEPFVGMLRLSDAPLVETLSHLGK